jgi:hypothetical protein
MRVRKVGCTHSVTRLSGDRPWGDLRQRWARLPLCFAEREVFRR